MRLPQLLTLMPLPCAKCVSLLNPPLIIAACDRDGADTRRGATYKCKWIPLWLQYSFNLFRRGILAREQDWKWNGYHFLAVLVHFHLSSPTLRPEDQVSRMVTTVSEFPYTIIPKAADWLHIYPTARSRQLSFVTVSNPLCLKIDFCVFSYQHLCHPSADMDCMCCQVMPFNVNSCCSLIIDCIKYYSRKNVFPNGWNTFTPLVLSWSRFIDNFVQRILLWLPLCSSQECFVAYRVKTTANTVSFQI